ncbi:MAG: hypothetical protein AAF394_16540, partial [Planctomycetota bacterium]
MLASILLSLASFYTTFTGMLHFMPQWLISGFITIAIQSLLLVTSWRIGFIVADRQGASPLDITVFLIAFVTSVFFSFVSLFDAIFDPELQERTRMTRVHNAVEETITDLEVRGQKRRQALVEELIETDAYASWRANVFEVSAVATGAKSILSDVLRRRARESDAEVSRLRSDAQLAAGNLKQLTAQITEGNARVELLKEKRVRLLEEVRDWEFKTREQNQLVIAKRAAMEAEAKGGDPSSNRPRGKGKVWRKLRNEYNVLKATYDGLAQSLRNAEGELSAVQNELSNLTTLILEAEAALPNLKAKVEGRSAEAKQVQKERTALGTSSTFDPDALVEGLHAQIADFATTFDLKPFEQAADSCTALLEQMRNIDDLKSQVSGLSCDRGAMANLINPISVAATNYEEFSKTCGPDSIDSISTLTFDQAVDRGRNCINLLGLPSSQARDLREELNRLIREEDPKASSFTKTSNALWAGEKLAYFALFIASTIDMLVLFCGLIGARSTKPKIAQHLGQQSERQLDESVFQALSIDLKIHPRDSSDTKIIKTMLAGVKTARQFDGENVYDAEIDLSELAPEFRDVTRNALVTLVSRGLAMADIEHAEVFYLRQGMLDAFREHVAEKAKRSPMRFLSQSDAAAEPVAPTP